MMSREQFIKLAKSFITKSELERFASNVFKLFDEDRNGFLDFGEFSLAISAQEGLESRDRLVWMFDRVYNEETAGALDFDQLEDTLSILLELVGVDHTKSKHKAREICKDVELDYYKGPISKDEFLQKALKSQVLKEVLMEST